MVRAKVVRFLGCGVIKFVDCRVQKLRNSASMSYTKRYFVNTLQDYRVGYETYADKNWNLQVQQTVNIIADRQKLSVKAADGGLYVGVAGIGYMFYHMSLSPSFVGDKSKLLEKGLEYLQPALAYAESNKRDKSQISAFVLGNAGIFAVTAAVYHAIGVY